MPLDTNNSGRVPNNVSAQNVPETLVEYDKWVCWEYEGDKKPPFDPDTGEYASTTDPETWSDFQSAIQAYRDENYDGVGFVLTEDGPFTDFDFDACRDPETGDIETEVQAIIDRLSSYTEFSPSETGLHTLTIGEKPEKYGCEGGEHIEVYDSNRYFTVTGYHLEETPECIEPRSDALQRIYETYLDETTSGQVEEIEIQDDSTDDSTINEGEQALHDLQDESTPTFNTVMEFLQGGIADFDEKELIKDSGRIDRSSADFVALSLLYRTMERYLDHPESTFHQITYQTYTHYCQRHPEMNDGQKRRWLTDDEDYRQGRLEHAVMRSDAKLFEMMVRKKSTGKRRENNEYSAMTYDAVWSALFELLPTNPPKLSNDMDPEIPATTEPEGTDGRMAIHNLYPGKEEVVNRAYQIDGGYNKRGSYEEAFRRLQAKYGEVKAARIGNTWLYYPANYPDPLDANYVLQYGEKYDPEDADKINSWTGEPELSEENAEPELMTDGGTQAHNAEAVNGMNN